MVYEAARIYILLEKSNKICSKSPTMSIKLQKDPRRLRFAEDTSPTCGGHVVRSPRCFLAPGVQRDLSRTRVSSITWSLTQERICTLSLRLRHVPRFFAPRATNGFEVGNLEDPTLPSRSPRGPRRDPPCLAQSGGSLRGPRFLSGPLREEDPEQEADEGQRAAEPWGGIVPHAAQHRGIWIVCGNQRGEK